MKADLPPNTASPPPPDAVKLSQSQIDALASFYKLGLTPADHELTSALRELLAAREELAALRGALVDSLDAILAGTVLLGANDCPRWYEQLSKLSAMARSLKDTTHD